MIGMTSKNSSSTLSTSPSPRRTSGPPSTKAPKVSAAVHKKIAEEMDATFRKNVAKSKADREARRQAQKS
jgi:hypothetical protein